MKNLNPASFRAISYIVTIIFALLIVYPLVYIGANAMKDAAKVYDTPPTLLPDPANSLSIVVDYSSMSEDGLLEKIQQDHVTSMLTTIYEMPRESIFEIKFYGTRDGDVIYYARSHRARIDLEKDHGVFKGVAITSRTLDYPERIQRTVDSMGYEYNPMGLDESFDESILSRNSLNDSIRDFIVNDYGINGQFVGTTLTHNNWLLFESFAYYFRLPSFLYSNNEVIRNFSFLVFLFNTAIVLIWAIVTQVTLCAITAFPLSRLLPKRTSNLMLLFFLGTTMIPFVSIMIPQFTMFHSMGLYDNYAAILLPHLLPYGFFVYLYKGFFDNLPESLFEAARIDGASNFYLFFKICIPLSKPIISVIALQTFLSNWNDFFWAWMVTENQRLWTLNVALYNISKITSVKPNFIMGLSLLTIVPVLLITIIFSNQIKESIAAAGIKG